MALAVSGFPSYVGDRPKFPENTQLRPHEPHVCKSALTRILQNITVTSARDAVPVIKAILSIKSPMPRPAISPLQTDLGLVSTSSSRPHSQVLIPAAKRPPSPHNSSGINLRYQPMAIVDPSSSDQAAVRGDGAISSLARKQQPQTRTQRSRTSPGPRGNKLEAIPNSWASASKPSDLRPIHPTQGTAQSRPLPRTGVSISRAAPSPAPRVTRLHVGQSARSSSVDRTSQVVGSRMPRQLPVQPTPKRLSLGVAMNTSKLASRSCTGTSPSVAAPALPMRSIPSSPTASPSLAHHIPVIARLPISGATNYKRETSPPLGQTPPLRAWSSACPTSPSLPHTLPSASLTRSAFSSGVPSSLSGPASPPRSPPVISISTDTAATATINIVSDTGDPYTGMNVPESRAKESKSPDSPTSVLSYASLTIFTPGTGGKRRSVGSNDGSIQLVEVDKHLRHIPEPDPGFGYQAYEWGVEEIGYYNDQLLRFPTSPPSSTPDPETYRNEEHLDVFVDNVYCAERSPSPIVYARPRTDDSDDDYGVPRPRHRVLADEANSRSKHVSSSGSRPSTAGNPTRPALGPDFSVHALSTNVIDSTRSKQDSSGHAVSGESISYHSDHSSSTYHGTRPKGKRREQYKYSIIPASKPSEAVELLSPRHLAPSSSSKEGINEVVRSPSPILYARRRSFDSNSEEIDILDDTRAAGSGEVVGYGQVGSVAPYGFLLSEPVGGDILGNKVRRRTAQPRSFLYEYSTPPVQHSFDKGFDEREREKEREGEREREKAEEIERGRGRERTQKGRGGRKERAFPMPLVNYNKEREKDEKEKKEKEREKPRTRKTSLGGIFEDLAAVTNVISGRKQAGDSTVNSRSRSPKCNKNKEKEGKEKEKRKWTVWELNVNIKEKSERGGDGGSCGIDIVEDGDSVLDIAGDGDHHDDDWSADESSAGMRERRQRHSLAGLEFR